MLYTGRSTAQQSSSISSSTERKEALKYLLRNLWWWWVNYMALTFMPTLHGKLESKKLSPTCWESTEHNRCRQTAVPKMLCPLNSMFIRVYPSQNKQSWWNLCPLWGCFSFFSSSSHLFFRRSPLRSSPSLHSVAVKMVTIVHRRSTHMVLMWIKGLHRRHFIHTESLRVPL